MAEANLTEGHKSFEGGAPHCDHLEICGQAWGGLMGEATHVEQVLREAHIAYAVEVPSAPTRWRARFPKFSGMQFYVDPQQSRCGRDALHRAGLVMGMVGEVQQGSTSSKRWGQPCPPS